MLTQDHVIEALKTVYDPEIPVNIYDLGLIYRVDLIDDGMVEVDMTLTAPACPVAGSLPHEVGRVVDALPEVKETIVRLVWDPPWSKELMSDEALLQLGML
jgi:FeS assembly SUF system protein